MTQDKARKRAARERAATTGERYVVARRNTGPAFEPTLGREPESSPPHGVLHRLTHRVPGVPEHVERGRTPRRKASHRAAPHRPHARNPRPHGEPRVLVAWQRRIALLLRAESDPPPTPTRLTAPT